MNSVSRKLASCSAPRRSPLVVMMHGGFGSGSQAEKSYGWDAEADSGHFVVAYPDGIDRAWNTGGGCCGTPGRTNVDDIGFITAPSLPVFAFPILETVADVGSFCRGHA